MAHVVAGAMDRLDCRKGGRSKTAAQLHRITSSHKGYGDPPGRASRRLNRSPSDGVNTSVGACLTGATPGQTQNLREVSPDKGSLANELVALRARGPKPILTLIELYHGDRQAAGQQGQGGAAKEMTLLGILDAKMSAGQVLEQTKPGATGDLGKTGMVLQGKGSGPVWI